MPISDIIVLIDAGYLKSTKDERKQNNKHWMASTQLLGCASRIALSLAFQYHIYYDELVAVQSESSGVIVATLI